VRRAALLLLALVGCDRETNPLYCAAHPTDHSTGCPFLDAAPLPDAAYKDAKYSDAPPNYYRIAGDVMGLTGTGLVLEDNGGDDLPRTADGVFIFQMPLLTGASYDVTVKTQPTDEKCTVMNGSGKVAGADVTNVVITCINPGAGCSTDNSVYCAVGTEDCCSGNMQCQPIANSCSGVKIICDDTADCAGMPGTICCATQNSQKHLSGVQCTDPGSCTGTSHLILCDPTAPVPCASGTCMPFTKPPELATLNYNSCQ